MNSHKSNTYDLLIAAESEDRSRSVIEAVIYGVFILSAVLSIFRAAAQPVSMPTHVGSAHTVSHVEQAG
jgi:hypothetical protein